MEFFNLSSANLKNFLAGRIQEATKMSRIFSSCQNFLKTIYVNFVWAKRSAVVEDSPSEFNWKRENLAAFCCHFPLMYTISSVTYFFYVIRYWQNMKSIVLPRMKYDYIWLLNVFLYERKLRTIRWINAVNVVYYLFLGNNQSSSVCSKDRGCVAKQRTNQRQH